MEQETNSLTDKKIAVQPELEVPRPYVPASQSPVEFSLKSILFGAFFGIVFGAANAYLGLKAGLTISTSIPVAVMTVAAFKTLQAMGRQSSILEANMSQTIGSASSSLASGIIFTLPALFLWELDPSLLQMTLLGLCGGLLGVLFMIPLRRFLIQKEHPNLPYPEGTACAEVLVASDVGGARAHNVFYGLGVGAAFKFIFGGLRLFPGSVHFEIPFLRKSQLGVEMSSALFGVGYILGPRIGLIMVGGGLLAWLVLIPLIDWWGQGMATPFFPETVKLISEMSPGELWNRYVRYIGAGAVATGGLITLARSIPTMIESFRVGAEQLRKRLGGTASAFVRTDHDLSLGFVGISVATLIIAMTLIPHIFASLDWIVGRGVAAVLVSLFAFFFVTVSSRIVGLVGVTSNPTSGMTIATLLGTSLVFLTLGWTGDMGKTSALTVGCVVAIAASIAGDTSQDLKTGFLLGATPRKQQIGELLGVLTSAVFVCMAVILLDQAYGFGTTEIPAPQATLMMLVIEGVLQSELPWILITVGIIVAIAAELFKIPSLPFAVGVYLPVTTTAAVALGGLLRGWLERQARDKNSRDRRREQGVLFGSGLVGGEGLVGVGIAGVAFYAGSAPQGIGTDWAGSAAPLLAAFVFFLLAFYFAQRARVN